MIPMVEPSDELDAAYEAMVEAIDHWEIVGPMTIRHQDSITHGVYMVRSKMLLEDTSALTGDGLANDNAQFLHFKDIQHAAAFIQYQGMAAAIAATRDTA